MLRQVALFHKITSGITICPTRYARVAATCFAMKSPQPFPPAGRNNAFPYHFTIKENTVREVEVGLRGKRGRSFVENTPREGSEEG